MAEEEKIEATAPESNTEEFIDDDGLKHVVVRDAEGKPLSDQAFDKDGNLRGEGIYKDGQFAGTKEYRTDDQGLNHVVVRDVEGKPISDQAFDKDGNLRGEGIYKDGQFVEEQKYDDVNTTLPAVRGQEMPARTQETQQEQPDLHPVRVEQTAETVNTVLPAVRGNEMPERAQEARTTEDKENLFTNNFIKIIQQGNKNSPDDARAFANSLQDLITDYQMQGLSAQEATEKMSAVLSSVYDLGIEQGLDPDVLKTSISQLSEKIGLSAEANQEGMTVANNVAQMDAPTVNRPRFQDDMDIEDAEIIEEIPAQANENGGHEETDAPVRTDGNGDHEGTDAPARGHESQGSFTFSEDEPEMTHTATPTASHTSDLKQQLLNTAFKNRYMLAEAENEEPQRMCPFAQLNVRTIEDNSDDEKNPYVKMELESGNRIYNRPNQVDVHYDTFVTKDEKGNTVREPQIFFEDCMAAVRVGMEKGWTSATLSGPDAYKEQMYLAMCAMGMKVVGYEPSEELKKEGERLAKLHAVDRDHAASIDQRFDALEAERKKAGIKEPEQIGKEFIDDMKKRGLGYTPPVQNAENSGNDNGGNTNDGNEAAGTPAAPASTNDGNEAAGTPAAPASTNDGNEAAGTPAAPANTNDGNETAGTPAAPATPAIENNGQEAVQQPQQLQLPEHVESQQPQRLQLPEHVESQQPQQLQLPEHVESQQQQTALVPVTPGIQKKMEAVAQSATTALAKTDPAKAQQAAAQIAATPGIANQLQLAGKTANEAKGNDVKAAQQQHQQETALVLAARSNNHSK